MRLFPRLLAVVAACAVFPAAHAACTPASIAGWFAAGGAGAYYADPNPVVGVARIGFNGVNGVTVTNYYQGQVGGVTALTGSGTYTLDSWCRGTATIALKKGTTPAGTITLQFVVSGTPTFPQITGLVSNPYDGFTGSVVLNKISL